MSEYGRQVRYAASHGLPPPERPVWEPGKHTPKTRNPPGWVLQTQQRKANGLAAAAEAAAERAAAAAATASTAVGGYRGQGAQACEYWEQGWDGLPWGTQPSLATAPPHYSGETTSRLWWDPEAAGGAGQAWGLEEAPPPAWEPPSTWGPHPPDHAPPQAQDIPAPRWPRGPREPSGPPTPRSKKDARGQGGRDGSGGEPPPKRPQTSAAAKKPPTIVAAPPSWGPPPSSVPARSAGWKPRTSAAPRVEEELVLARHEAGKRWKANEAKIAAKAVVRTRAADKIIAQGKVAVAAELALLSSTAPSREEQQQPDERNAHPGAREEDPGRAGEEVASGPWWESPEEAPEEPRQPPQAPRGQYHDLLLEAETVEAEFNDSRRDREVRMGFEDEEDADGRAHGLLLEEEDLWEERPPWAEEEDDAGETDVKQEEEEAYEGDDPWQGNDGSESSVKEEDDFPWHEHAEPPAFNKNVESYTTWAHRVGTPEGWYSPY